MTRTPLRSTPSSMRLAISGAHSTGKTTLVQELARALPRARVTEESYVTLLGEGVEFGAIPDASDYERLCEHACALYEAPSDGVVLFDRTPADYLAYLL